MNRYETMTEEEREETVLAFMKLFGCKTKEELDEFTKKLKRRRADPASRLGAYKNWIQVRI